MVITRSFIRLDVLVSNVALGQLILVVIVALAFFFSAEVPNGDLRSLFSRSLFKNIQLH